MSQCQTCRIADKTLHQVQPGPNHLLFLGRQRILPRRELRPRWTRRLNAQDQEVKNTHLENQTLKASEAVRRV